MDLAGTFVHFPQPKVRGKKPGLKEEVLKGSKKNWEEMNTVPGPIIPIISVNLQHS